MDKGINIHLYPSNFLHESRIEKIADVLASLALFRAIWLIGVREPDLPAKESFSEAVTLFRLGRPTMRTSLIAKLSAFVQYYIDTFRLLRHERVTCINAHSLSVLPLAVALKYWKNCALIYDTHELETETHSLRGFRQRLAKVVENAFVRRADAIFCVSDEISEWYASRYRVKRPVTILNSPLAETAPESDYLRDRFNLRKDQKIALYLGVIEPGRSVELLVETFEQREDDSVVVIFVGYGSLVDFIEASPACGRTVFFHPAVPRSQIVALAASADLGLCLVSPTCLSYAYCMPNKLFEYLMSGLPVLVSPCASLIKFVERHRVGFVLDQLTHSAVAAQIRSLVASDLNEMKQRARELALQNSWGTQATRLRIEYQKMFEKP